MRYKDALRSRDCALSRSEYYADLEARLRSAERAAQGNTEEWVERRGGIAQEHITLTSEQFRALQRAKNCLAVSGD